MEAGGGNNGEWSYAIGQSLLTWRTALSQNRFVRTALVAALLGRLFSFDLNLDFAPQHIRGSGMSGWIPLEGDFLPLNGYIGLELVQLVLAGKADLHALFIYFQAA